MTRHLLLASLKGMPIFKVTGATLSFNIVSNYGNNYGGGWGTGRSVTYEYQYFHFDNLNECYKNLGSGSGMTEGYCTSRKAGCTTNTILCFVNSNDDD